MTDLSQNFRIVQYQAADKIKNLKSKKQISLYALFALSGGALFLEASGIEGSPLFVIAVLLILICIYAIFKIDNQVSAIETNLRLLESSYEENDASRYESTSADLEHLLKRTNIER
jgi:hypothetical protein